MIRSALSKDEKIVSDYAVKYLSCYYKNLEEYVSSSFVDKSKKIWVYQVDEDIAGYLILKNNPLKDYVKISSFFIQEEYQKKGFGTELYNFCIDYIRNNIKKKEVIVTVNMKSFSSCSFFENKGFVPKTKLFDKYIDNSIEVVYVKML